MVALYKAFKHIRIAAEKVQESANNAAELVDEVRNVVVNPGIVALMIEKYIKKYQKKRKGDR